MVSQQISWGRHHPLYIWYWNLLYSSYGCPCRSGWQWQSLSSEILPSIHWHWCWEFFLQNTTSMWHVRFQSHPGIRHFTRIYLSLVSASCRNNQAKCKNEPHRCYAYSSYKTHIFKINMFLVLIRKPRTSRQTSARLQEFWGNIWICLT